MYSYRPAGLKKGPQELIIITNQEAIVPTADTKRRLEQLARDVDTSAADIGRVKGLLTLAIDATSEATDNKIHSQLEALQQDLDANDSTLTAQQVAQRINNIRDHFYTDDASTSASAASPAASASKPQSRVWPLIRHAGGAVWRWLSWKRALALAVLLALAYAAWWLWEPASTSGNDGAAVATKSERATKPTATVTTSGDYASCSSARWTGSTTAIIVTDTGKWKLDGVRSGKGGTCIFSSGERKGDPIPAHCISGGSSRGATSKCPKRTKL